MIPEISQASRGRSALNADGVPLLVGRPWLTKLVKRTDPDASIIHRSLRWHSSRLHSAGIQPAPPLMTRGGP
jgi:hypothetical protein